MSDHMLTKWRRLLLLRDCELFGDRRVPVCVMCRRPHYVSALQAHHIYPKSLYPDIALQLQNGVMLCLGCHQAVVHASDSFRDIETIHNWKRFVPMFNRWTGLAVNKRFETENQGRLT